MAPLHRLLVEFLQYPGSSHDWLQQWEVDFYTNGVTELLGTSLALPPGGNRQRYTGSQLAMAITTMKFALAFYRDQPLLDSAKQPDDVCRLLEQLETWPSTNRPLLNTEQLDSLGDYLSRIFGNSFVRQLLLRPLFETPYRLEWKLNRPLTLRGVSPEPPPERGQAKKAKPKPKSKKRGKKSAPPPPEEPTHEVGVQLRPPGYLPLRLAAPLPVLYELYTGEVYDEEEMKKKKKKGRRK
ncbi:uncharacterized protein LOC119112399 isoform X2 [Pollicipes pollicipes]|uniref:uncharacterized protein LOC119112399 isoform X2 n=1 Tax=Pollicipes pollicipes TaxID=41117 RepID=UPI0018850C80|nr:uncharacterized protein LOC119112399 isoform X2 [Pollicipes pollicipes]